MVVEGPTRRAVGVPGAHGLSSLILIFSGWLCACSSSGNAGNPTTQVDGSIASGGASSGGSGGAATGGVNANTGGASSAGGAGGGAAGSAGAGGSGAGGASNADASAPKGVLVIVGSGSYGGSNGRLSLFRYDLGTGEWTPKGGIDAGGLESFAAWDGARSALYAADEADGNLRRFAFDAATFSLSAPTSVTTAGHPVFVTTTRSGAFALVAHYNEGSVQAFPTSGGTPGAAVDSESPGSQAHAIVLSPDERFAYVPCKGSDLVARYAFDAATGALTAAPPATTTQANDGPRHIAFTRDGRRAFVVNEKSSTVLSFTVDPVTGALTQADRVSSLPEGFSGQSTGAEILVSPTGGTVYVTNRETGTDGDVLSLRVESDGHLTPLVHRSTKGQTPRSAALDPSGSVLFVGNQDDTTVAILPVDGATGGLGTARVVDVGNAPYFVGTAPLSE
ncbi:MAG TPA: beta-propeller fold lactonase family protein [Polyangiaceae bacterium]|nr:beta-propeller fold lactonase family protein [Polyangiaceae bacterium]